jgi:hypothetical protein
MQGKVLVITGATAVGFDAMGMESGKCRVSAGKIF